MYVSLFVHLICLVIHIMIVTIKFDHYPRSVTVHFSMFNVYHSALTIEVNIQTYPACEHGHLAHLHIFSL